MNNFLTYYVVGVVLASNSSTVLEIKVASKGLSDVKNPYIITCPGYRSDNSITSLVLKASKAIAIYNGVGSDSGSLKGAERLGKRCFRTKAVVNLSVGAQIPVNFFNI